MKSNSEILKQLTCLIIAGGQTNTSSFAVWRSEPVFAYWKQISAQFGSIPSQLQKEWDEVPIDAALRLR